jgi:hypothetical protein
MADDAAIPEDDVQSALGEFTELWEEMSSIERCRLLRLLIEKVDYDGSQISIAFHPTGFSNLLNYISQTAAKEVA